MGWHKVKELPHSSSNSFQQPLNNALMIKKDLKNDNFINHGRNLIK